MAKKKSPRKAAPRASNRSNSHDPKFERVLGVFAHPDDPEFGAGGSMAKLAKDGANVTYVIVTDGSQGGEDPNQKDSELVSIRQREQRAAAKVLGIKRVEFLGYKDGHLAPDLKLRRDIVRMIRKHKPELDLSRRFDQISSAHAAYWASPGCTSSAAIQPVEPVARVLTSVRSTHKNDRASASCLATALNCSVRLRTRAGSP